MVLEALATFSRLIYNDPKFKCYSRAWVHVSHRFDLNKIRESIVSQLFGKENQANERHVVHSSLTKLLPGKNIMIVLDDLWEDNQFQLMDLKDMLYHDDSKIIILVTTRSESVAERISANLQPYKILPLMNDMCWDIIKQRSDFGARDDKEKLRAIGQEIAQKCAGVALAAQSLGFTLRDKNFDQWMKVKDNDIWKEHISKDISVPNHVLASLMFRKANRITLSHGSLQEAYYAAPRTIFPSRVTQGQAVGSVAMGAVHVGGVDYDDDRRALEALCAAVPTELGASLANKVTAKLAWEAIAAARIGGD
ncbi:putative disease resistance protein RGA1 [Miscanthus floridulus]|uniref:putative disease resistance protein RGA1 n=1 Tax=Miscanthus floridulus TaxID=154761 RepID=UPI003457A49C